MPNGGTYACSEHVESNEKNLDSEKRLMVSLTEKSDRGEAELKRRECTLPMNDEYRGYGRTISLDLLTRAKVQFQIPLPNS